MTKANVVAAIAAKTGVDKESTESIVDGFFRVVRSSLENGENVYIRGFGTFLVKKRAAKTARNITKNTALLVPESYIPTFKPSPDFMNRVKAAVPDGKGLKTAL